MGAILAIIAMLGFMATVILLGFVKVEIPPANRDFFLMGFGAMISFATSGVGYYIGSSKGSADKTAANDKKDVTIANLTANGKSPMP